MSEEKIIVDKELVFAPPQRDISGIEASSSGPEEGLNPIQEGVVVPDLPAPDVPAPDVPVPDLPAPDLRAPDLPAPDLPAPESVAESGVDSAVLYDVVVDVGEDVLEEMLKDVIAKVKARMGEIDMGNISLSTLPMLIRIVMEAVEQTIIKGNAQKVFATRVISELIDELPESAEKGFLKATCASGGIEGTIDLVVAASKGELDVNKVASVALKSCAPSFLGYLRAKVSSTWKCRGATWKCRVKKSENAAHE